MTDTTTRITKEDLDELLAQFPLLEYEVKSLLISPGAPIDLTEAVQQPEGHGSVILNWKIVDTETGVTIVAFAGGCSKAVADFICDTMNGGGDARGNILGARDGVRQPPSEIRRYITYIKDHYDLLMEIMDTEHATRETQDLIASVYELMTSPRRRQEDIIIRIYFYLYRREIQKRREITLMLRDIAHPDE